MVLPEPPVISYDKKSVQQPEKISTHSLVLNVLHGDIIEISSSSMRWSTAKELHLIVS